MNRTKRWRLLAIFLFLLNGEAYAITNAECTQAVMGEARGESYEGKVALAEALYRRGTLKGVYGYKVKVNEPRRIWKQAEDACIEGRTSNTVPGATHWEGTAFKTPYWAASMKEVKVVGNQRFYAEK